MAVLPEVRRQLEDGDRRRLRDIAENGHDGGGRSPGDSSRRTRTRRREAAASVGQRGDGRRGRITLSGAAREEALAANRKQRRGDSQSELSRKIYTNDNQLANV